jgi:hypothetical protein
MLGNQADPLTQLRDIHLPSSIGWWPVAYGWMVLVVLIAVLAVFSGIYIGRLVRWGRPRREALRLLKQYEKDYQQALKQRGGLQQKITVEEPLIQPAGTFSPCLGRGENERSYMEGMACQQVSANISELLRRVALAYFPREQIAGLQGEQWVAFLNKTSKGIDFNVVQACLVALPYQRPHSMDLSGLFDCARRWILQRRGRCLS